MNIYRIYVNTGFAGAIHEEEIESEVELSRSELEEQAAQLMFETIEYGVEVLEGEFDED